MKIIVDSSTLISLAKVNMIGILEKIDGEILCPEEIYTECVEEGMAKGHPDVIIIKQLFDKNRVNIKKIKQPMKFKGVSETDSKVLSLAIQEKPGYLFVNDTKLARRAEFEGFEVRGSPDILLRMQNKKIINRERYIHLISELHKKNRLSTKNMKKYLER